MQRVGLSGHFSSWVRVRPQRLVLGLVFILWVTSGMEGRSDIPKFAEDLQFLQVVGYLMVSEEIQKDLAELDK